MKDFKFFNKGENESGQIALFSNIEFSRFDNAEFCFQFENREPIVFARGNSTLAITLQPNSNANIEFTDGDNKFTLFAREAQ
jgi:hypothetical protein